MFIFQNMLIFIYIASYNSITMNNFKQHRKLNNLQVKAEKCLTRDEAKKILAKASKAQDKISS